MGHGVIEVTLLSICVGPRIILGVDIGNGDLDVNNWSSCIESFHNVLSLWRQSSLSFQGKALVTNALALSGLWYMASVLPMPDWALKDINKLLFDFFWKG